MKNLNNWVLKKKGAMKWAEATKEIKGRSGKQIRERWFNILNPQINKAKWTEEEERLLFQLYQKFGPKWCYLVNQFENRTENSIKNRFYSTLRRVATEHKRGIEKEWKKRNKKLKLKSINTTQNDQTLENLDNLNIQKDELYLENPQIAKTEDLLKFLPLVIKSLKAFTKDLPKSSAIGKSNKRGKRKIKNKRKRVEEKSSQKDCKINNKRKKVSENSNEENKDLEEDTKIDKVFENNEKVVLPENKISNWTNNGEHKLSKQLIEQMDADFNEIKYGVGGLTNNKPWLSVKSGDNLIDHFPDDPFNKIEEDHWRKRKNSFLIDFYKFGESHSMNLSNYNYSIEWRELEQKLLNECDEIIDDINKEIDDFKAIQNTSLQSNLT